MIRERFILVIICSVLSSLLTDRSLAIASASSQLSLPSKFDLKSSLNNKIAYNNFYQPSNRERKNLPEIAVARSKPQSNNNEGLTDEKSSREIDRNLSLVAMAVMFAVSLFLLWSLFRQPKQTAESLTLNEDNDLKPTSEADNQPETLPQLNSEIQSNTLSLKETVSNDSDGIEWLVEKYQATVKHQETSHPTNYQFEVDIDVVAELIKDLQQGDRRLRRKAIWELAERGDPRSIQPLVNIVSDVSSLDKSLISNAIAQIVHRNFQPINHRLFTNLQQDNPQVKKNAINDLSDLYLFIAPVAKKLLQMQLDSDPEVRQTAVEALRRLNININSCSEPDRNYRDRYGNFVAKKAQVNLRLVGDLPIESDAEL